MKLKMSKTGLVVTIAIIILGIYDLIVVLFSGESSSVSAFLINAGIKSPLLIFTFGFVAGHLFGRMTPYDEAKERDGLRVYANIHDAKFKDGDHVHLEWREDRIASDTHEGTLSNVKRL